MPSERFLKLAPEKKKRILQAGYREFSRTSVGQASINSIIKEAEISRGSFYTYFEDKMDLLSFIMSDLMMDFADTVKEFLRQCGGDLFKSTEFLYEKCVHELKDNENMKFLKNVFTDGGIQTELLRPEGSGRGERPFQQMQHFCSELLPEIDRGKYGLDEEHFGHLIPMVIMITIRTAALTVVNPEKEENLKRGMKIELELLKYGALTRNAGEGSTVR